MNFPTHRQSIIFIAQNWVLNSRLFLHHRHLRSLLILIPRVFFTFNSRESFFYYFRQWCSVYNLVCVSVIVVVSWVGKFLDVIEMYVKWKFSSLFLARSLFQSWCWLSDPFCRLIPTSHNQIIFQIQSPWVLIFRDISQTLRDSGAHPAKVLEKLTFVYDFLNEPISDRRRSILSTKSQLTGTIEVWRVKTFLWGLE